MSKFEDLTPYAYFGEPNELLLNVGWLEGDFKKGQVPERFIEKLKIFLDYSTLQTRGLHNCPYCERKKKTHTGMTSSNEIRVIGIDGKIYACPSLIYHYIKEHSYQPPLEFIMAVLIGPAPDSVAYQSIFNIQKRPKR